MVSLKSVTERYHQNFTVIEGGKGIISATLGETDQGTQPSYVFVQPRHVLRTSKNTALRPGMVIKGETSDVYIVGDNGPSQTYRGTLWLSWRLFKATGQYVWARRVKTIDPITKTEMDSGTPQVMGTIWAAIEPLDREASDREMRFSFEQARIITASGVLAEDLVDNRAVTKMDKQLGLSIGILT